MGLTQLTSNQTSMGNKASKKEEEEPCQKLACKIQACLSEKNYNQTKCMEEIEAYNQCIKRHEEAKRQKS